MQLSRTGKKWISVIVTIRPVFPDPVTYIIFYEGTALLAHFEYQNVHVVNVLLEYIVMAI